MKGIQVIKILLLILIVTIVTGCASNGHFTSRKYTARNYKSYKYRAPKTNLNETIKDEPVYVTSDNGLKESDLKKEENLFLQIENIETNTSLKKEKAKLILTSPIKKIKEQIKEYKKELKKNKAENQEIKTSLSSKRIGTKALISLILSILALLCNFIGLIFFNEFGFFILVLFFAVGLALGITSLILGIKGLKNHRENKGSIHDLIFSIIGISISGIAILVSIFFLIGPLSEIISWL